MLTDTSYSACPIVYVFIYFKFWQAYDTRLLKYALDHGILTN